MRCVSTLTPRQYCPSPLLFPAIHFLSNDTFYAGWLIYTGEAVKIYMVYALADTNISLFLLVAMASKRPQHLVLPSENTLPYPPSPQFPIYAVAMPSQKCFLTIDATVFGPLS